MVGVGTGAFPVGEMMGFFSGTLGLYAADGWCLSAYC